MKVEILGSGGATATPRPGCSCGACVAAREHGLPHSRTGPSVFVHGPNVLFDTPEEARLQHDRAGLGAIAACFYSHWHPDHTMGRRVWETRNLAGFSRWPPDAAEQRTTDVYLPQQVALDFAEYIGLSEHFAFLEARRFVRLHELADGETVQVGGTSIRPFRLHEDYVYAFELTEGGKRLLLVMDELHGWQPPEELRDADLVVLPMGVCDVHPLTGERLIHPDHPVLRTEATFADTLAVVDALAPRRVVLSHVEEAFGLTVEDLRALEGIVGRAITFAWDTMQVEV